MTTLGHANPIARRRQWHNHSHTPKLVVAKVQSESFRSLPSFEDGSHIETMMSVSRSSMPRNTGSSHMWESTGGSVSWTENGSPQMYNRHNKPTPISRILEGNMLSADSLEDSVKLEKRKRDSPKERNRTAVPSTKSAGAIRPTDANGGHRQLRQKNIREKNLQSKEVVAKQRAEDTRVSPKKRRSFLSYFFGREDSSRISPEGPGSAAAFNATEENRRRSM